MTRLSTAELRAEQARLLTLANEMARRHWGVEYTGGLRLTARNWTRRGASFAWNTETGLQEVRMSAPVNERLGPENTAGNLLHELVHWRLYTLGGPFRDDDVEFVAECLRVGAPFSQTQAAQRAYEAYLQTKKEAA